MPQCFSIQPKLRRSLRVHDVRGVFATHGVPAFISGLAAVVSAFLANEQEYGTRYSIDPLQILHLYSPLNAHNVILTITRRRSNVIDVHTIYCLYIYRIIFYFTYSLYKLYPARVPERNTIKYQELIQIHAEFQPNQGRSSYVQGAYQLGALAVTIVVALVGGWLTGKRYYLTWTFGPARILRTLYTHDPFDNPSCYTLPHDPEIINFPALMG